MTSVRQPAPGRPYDALYGASASLTSRDLFPKPRQPLPTLTDSTPNPSSTCKHADPIYTVSGQRDHHRNVHGDPKVEKVQHFDNMYSEVKSFPNHTMRCVRPRGESDPRPVQHFVSRPGSPPIRNCPRTKT